MPDRVGPNPLVCRIVTALSNRDALALIEQTEPALDHALQVRAHLRRTSRPYDPERRLALSEVYEELGTAMQPIRRAMGQLSYLRLDPDVEDDLRETSELVQRERRKIRKMMKAGRPEP